MTCLVVETRKETRGERWSKEYGVRFRVYRRWGCDAPSILCTNSSGAALMAHMREPRRCPIVDFRREMGKPSTGYDQNMAARSKYCSCCDEIIFDCD